MLHALPDEDPLVATLAGMSPDQRKYLTHVLAYLDTLCAAVESRPDRQVSVSLAPDLSEGVVFFRLTPPAVLEAGEDFMQRAVDLADAWEGLADLFTVPFPHTGGPEPEAEPAPPAHRGVFAINPDEVSPEAAQVMRDALRPVADEVPFCGLPEARLAEIAAIPDEAIDTSEIPEQGEVFFKSARVERKSPVEAGVEIRKVIEAVRAEASRPVVARHPVEHWPPEDDLLLAQYFEDGTPMEVICDTLGRERKAILARWKAINPAALSPKELRPLIEQLQARISAAA